MNELTTMLNDLRYALRMLRKNPGFTVVAVLTLSLGIGANTAIFSVVNGVLLRPLPYQQPDRLLIIREKSPEFEAMSVSYLNFQDWQRQNKSCEAIAAFRPDDFNLTGLRDPERLRGLMSSAAFFSVLGVKPVLGRTFLPEEDSLGGNPVVLISENLWRQRFEADPGILGHTLNLNGTVHTVVGIVPAGFRFRGRADLFTPIGQWNSILMTDREYHPDINVLARRKPGISYEQVRADFTGIARGLAEQYPKTNAGHGVALWSLKDDIVGDVRPSLWVLLGAVGFVLLISCANLANLLLARATARQKEIAVRTALGAGRVRIVRQLLTESTFLSLAGGALGLVLASWGTDLMMKAVPQSLPRMEDIVIDGRVLVFTLLASILTGVFFGIAPALQLSGSDLRDALKESGRSSIGGRRRLRDLLVVGEVALALVLLDGGALMIRSIWNLHQVKPGFDPHNILTLQVALSPAKSSTAATVRLAYQQLLERIRVIPSVDLAAATMDLPMSDDSETPVWIEGHQRPQSMADMPWVLLYPTTPEFLHVMRIPVVRGRFFSERDTEKSPEVVVIDEVMASSLFPGENPIGKRLMVGGPDMRIGGMAEIVGIVGHVRHWGLAADTTAKIRSQLYMPFAQIPDQFMQGATSGSTLVLRTSSNPARLANAVRAQVVGADRDQPVFNVRSMEQIVGDSIAQQRLAMLLLSIFAGIALLLASIGIYGVISYSVSQRSHEIGIRMALGAERRDVLRLVVAQGTVLTLAGVAIGIFLAFLVTRAMSALLFGISATDPLTFGGVSIVLTSVALLANYIPARRATKVDPMVALRYE